MSTLDTKILIRGLVAWMQLEGVTPTKTRVMKFLYLADLHHARYKNGTTLTNWVWHVDKFGPLAVEGMRELDRAVRDGWLLQINDSSSQDPDSGPRAVIYTLPRAEREAAANALPPVIGRVRHWIKKYGNETGALLRFVYGNTEPMEHASEGDRLDFSLAHPIDTPAPIASLPFKGKDIKRMKDAIRKLCESHDKALEEVEQSDIYDDVYHREIPRDDSQPHGDVVITFPKR